MALLLGIEFDTEMPMSVDPTFFFLLRFALLPPNITRSPITIDGFHTGLQFLSLS